MPAPGGQPGAEPMSRIVSLLPSATEILCALGLRDNIVGCTHECDYPTGVSSLPHVTKSLLPPGLSCEQIDKAVAATLKADAHTIYALDETLLRELAPEAIVTQTLCDVCAVPEGKVRDVAACSLPSCAVLTADPSCLDDLFDSIRTVGKGVRASSTEAVVDGLRARLQRVQLATEGLAKRRVAVLEWPDPPYAPGHWVPDQVKAAGGEPALGKSGCKSERITWDALFESRPDVIVCAFCGFDLKQNEQRIREIENTAEWKTLVTSADVYACDASAYFSRPGPRLIDGAELLAYVLHGETMADICKPVRGQFSKLVGLEWIDLVDLA